MASAAFDCTVRAAHRSVLETCDPERYQLTQPVCQQLSAVDNGLRHMKLDNHFLDRSELWRQRVPCSEVAEHRERSTDALRRGEAFLQDYRAAMSKEFAETLTDGQSAANQSAALDGLRGFRREFDPNALAAHNRVQRFCDWVGVTDRFTGYRNNLTRGSREPLRFDPQWRRGDADFPRLCHPKFVPETLANSGPPQRTKFDYVINPQPDFSVIGRPLMKAEPEARTTEYEDRYLWPDSRNLQPLPWSRNPRKDCQ
uniref:DUF1311 domain-containing protein n=1 Tax=Macrostomum lignano TaxID=282301 RepID=A0A1I8HQ41_9PLAT